MGLAASDSIIVLEAQPKPNVAMCKGCALRNPTKTPRYAHG